jgi:putative ABC transport system permease protein
VLGRLLRVNGAATENDQFQRFPVRLSYRSARIPSETIVAGRDFPGTYDSSSPGDAEISVEQKFAERNNFHLGDEIEFEVQSVPIKARITSIRHIQWTSFNPNFFIMFQPGVLDDAPKTWIANVNLSGGIDEKVRLQYELTRDFPDVSVIDIGGMITRVLEVARSVIGPVRAAAWIAVVMSFLILIGVVMHNLKLRDAEIDIEKLLGADRDLIRGLIVGEYAAIAVFAWFVGATSALALAWLVARQALDIQLKISGLAFALSAVLTVAATVIIARISADRVLNLRGASRKL